MKYLILWLITVRVIHLLALHDFYQGLNKEKIKQYKANYIAIIIKDLIVVTISTEIVLFMNLIYMLLEKLIIIAEKLMDIVLRINNKKENIERFIVSKITRFIK